MGYREIARKYNINHVVIMKWGRTYLENGERALLEKQRGRSCKEGSPKKWRPPKLNKQAEKNLLAEVQQLRMENEYLKKLNALTQEIKIEWIKSNLISFGLFNYMKKHTRRLSLSMLLNFINILSKLWGALQKISASFLLPFV